ncbi:MAG: Type 1 glutamine amidotransferase-like domain-containing protein [Acidimicrobiales bacterium]
MGAESSPGPLALVGSGEYLPQMTTIEGALIAGRAPRYVQLATAAVPDGPKVVERWHNLGRTQAERLGVEAVILPVNDRNDALNQKNVELVAGAGLIYMSGGNPGYLADALRDTPLWEAIVQAWRAGSALAGCSAGAMAMTTWVPSLRHPKKGGTPGLGLLTNLRVIPHFDMFTKRMPDVAARFLLPFDEEATILGIDEDTAIVGGPEEWTVQGRQSAWLLHPNSRDELPTGTTFTTRK